MVPLLLMVPVVLQGWRENSPFTAPGDLVFFGDRPDHPLNRRTFADVLRRGLAAAKIKVGARFLTTHSFRHTYNTVVRRVVSEEALRRIVGHGYERMSAHYDHPQPRDLIRGLEPSRAQIEAAFTWQKEPQAASRKGP